MLGPLPQLLIMVGNVLTPGKGFSEGPFSSEAELREMVDLAEASSLIESGESKMIHSVFELGDTSVREVMVPRTDVVYIERHKTLRQAMSLFLRSGFSRVPVVGEDLDDILGFVYLKDISKRVFDRQAAETTEHVDSMMRPVFHVPDSKPVDDLLREMQAQRRHIAVVVDEYGGTAGIVTIEDILEEIVGEITDEFDAEEVPVEELPDGSTRVSARFPVDDLDEIVGVEIDDDEVDSVGGLMAKHLGKVPIPGSSVEVEGLLFVAEEAKGRRKKVGTVLISRVGVPGLTQDRGPWRAEDKKLVVLAKATRARTGATRGRRAARPRRPHLRRRHRRPALAAGLGGRRRRRDGGHQRRAGGRGRRRARRPGAERGRPRPLRDLAGPGVPVHLGTSGRGRGGHRPLLTPSATTDWLDQEWRN